MATDQNLSQCVNLTNEQDAYIWLYSPLETAIVTGILPCAGILGLIANIVFQIAVVRNPDLRTKTNYYLFSLAIFDELFIIAGALIWFLGSYIASPVSYAIPFHNCWLIIGAIVTCHLASIGLIALVAFDRYIAVCHHVTYRNKFTAATTKKIIVSNAIVSAILSAGFQRWGKNVTLCLIWPDTEEYANLPTSINVCDSAYNFPFAELLFYDLPFYVVLILNIFLYTKIVRHFSKASTTTTVKGAANTSIRHQVTRVLIVNGVAFFLCQVPYRLITFSDIVKHTTGSGLFTDEQYELVLIVGRMFLILNSTINPYIYGLTSKYYRRGIKEVFCRSRQADVDGQEENMTGFTPVGDSKSGTDGHDERNQIESGSGNKAKE